MIVIPLFRVPNDREVGDWQAAANVERIAFVALVAAVPVPRPAPPL